MDSEYLDGLMPGVLGQLQIQRRSSLYFSNPVLWAQDHLGIRLWDVQGDIAMDVVTNKNVAVKAGHEVGKSFLAGVLICWWIDTRWNLPGGCFVVSTAPSTKQINAIVWREIRELWVLSHERFRDKKIDHALPGYITSDAHWKLPNGIELGYGTKPPEGKDDTMSGIHARYVLAVGDEAVGLSEALIGDLANITSNATSRRFIIMNPTNPLSYAGKIFKEDTGTWELRTISVFDSPNFHGGDRCECERHEGQLEGLGFPPFVLEKLVDQGYVDDMLRDYGEKHPNYISRVLGEFAWDMGPTLISPEDMASGLDADIDPDVDSLPVLGVDVSRSKKGDMNTVYSFQAGSRPPRDGEDDEEVQGHQLRFVEAWNEKNAMRTAQRVHDHAIGMGATEIRIDGSGLGGPIADRIRELGGEWSDMQAYVVIEMIGGNPAPDRVRHGNIRAYWYADFQERLLKGLIDIDHTDDKLQEELLGIETKFPQSGVQKMYIESKKDMQKRGVGSPDFADAAIYASADTSALLENPLGGLRPGDTVLVDPWELMNMGIHDAGMPVT